MFQERLCSIIIFTKFIIVLYRGAEFKVARETTFATVAQQKIMGLQCGICFMMPFRRPEYFWWLSSFLEKLCAPGVVGY